MEPWYRVVQPRPAVTAGRSFNTDESAVLLDAMLPGFPEVI